MEPPLPMVGAGVAVNDAVSSLESSDALIVLDGGQPIGVVTRQDVLAHLAL
jgi:cystathionine beta-synthase